jgi:hypothetical protein
MSDTQRDIASFMIRFTQDLWRDTNGSPEIQLRGRIRHVQGDEEIMFTDFSDVIRFIQGHLAQLTLNALPGGNRLDQEKALKESFKIWDDFTESYTNMLFDAMERTIDQSDAIKRQMEKTVEETVRVWQPQGRGVEEVASSLKILSEQLQGLTDRIGKLEELIKGES